MNSSETEEFKLILDKLEPVLANLPPVIISIDGLDGVGKTTLGRYLAWKFNITLIESDIFIKKKQSTELNIKYRNTDIKKLIKFRLDKQRPVILEGICSLKILKTLKYQSQYHIRLTSRTREEDSSFIKMWKRYENQYHPTDSNFLKLEMPLSL